MKMTEIAPGLIVPGHGKDIPDSHLTHASELISRFRSGERVYKQINLRRSGLWKINVGGTWRLLSRNQGQTWALLRHEQYIREIHRCR
jgi:hypothetical protein